MLNPEVIKKLRLSKGYSQENMAMDLGLSQSQYSRRENGTIEFSLVEIRRICKILDVDLHKTVVSLIGIIPDELTQDELFKTETNVLLTDMEKLINETQILTGKLKKALGDKIN
jgi:transcriptional regulator with XRE-family HTH domain